MDARYAIAAAIRDALAGMPPGPWTVYAGPPELAVPPAVWITGRAPYRTDGAPICQVQLGLAAIVAVPRASGPEGLDHVDRAADAIMPALRAIPTDSGLQVVPGSLSSVYTMDTQSGELLAGSIDLDAYV